MVIGAQFSGCLKIDYRGRFNIINWLGKEIGCNYDPINGNVLYPESGVRIVLHNNVDKIHAFTCNPTGMLYNSCNSCGCSLLSGQI